MNKQTKALTNEQYEEVIRTIADGFLEHRPNKRIAAALTLEANLGMRISDILNLRLCDIVRDGNTWHLDVIEQKSGKPRTFTVPDRVYDFIKSYCYDNGISKTEKIFPISERAVQKHLKFACDFLELDDIGTHSFRKNFATGVYQNNDYNIVLVQQLLQHSSPAITQRYIGIDSKQIQEALEKQVNIVI